MPTDFVSAGNSKSSGIAFLVAAGIVYEIIAAACSSPQTTEINADSRADTLMKWVNIGLVQAAFFVGAACYYDPALKKPIITGGLAAGGIMYASYYYAKQWGLASNEPGTESRK